MCLVLRIVLSAKVLHVMLEVVFIAVVLLVVVLLVVVLLVVVLLPCCGCERGLEGRIVKRPLSPSLQTFFSPLLE